jgi:PTH1 family peptidyl-tRNA hydrolase
VDPWLVVGLGNPGTEYAGTRHNAGAMVVRALAGRLGVRLRKVRMLAVSAADGRIEGGPVVLAVPETFMNVSGPPVASLARKRGIAVDRVVVCHDDIDLAFGALRMKHGGGTAGHHGLDSLVQAFRSPAFFRVRLGVGRPAARRDHLSFLLRPFAKAEREHVQALVEEAADATVALITDGLGAAQSRCNRSGPPQGHVSSHP